MLRSRLCRFTDSLFISDAESASDLSLLQTNGVTHVISAMPTRPAHDCIKYLIVPVVDSEIEDIIPHLPGTIEFINNALKDGGKVLIHCAAGISRSSTICINYLMHSKGIAYEDALTIVKTARPIVCPNSGFREQLRLIEEMKWQLEGDTAAHRAYRMRKLWSLVHQGSSRSVALEPLLASDPAFHRVEGRVHACIDCGRRLFADSNVLNFHPGRSCVADTFVIDPIAWMQPSSFPTGDDAPLQCPGCNSNIGRIHFKLNWRCVCQLGWSPTIRVRKTKVKEAPPMVAEERETQQKTANDEKTLNSLASEGFLLRTDSGIVISSTVSLSLSLSEKVFRAPGKFNARDFIKVFPRRSMQSKGGLYLCGAGGETDESTIKELLIQEALGCSVVAIVHDLFERKQTLGEVLVKSGRDFYVKEGILGDGNPMRRLVVEWSKAEGRLVMGKSATELRRYLVGLGFSVHEVPSLQQVPHPLSSSSSATPQSSGCVLMVAPVGFAFNAETATDNAFMHQVTADQREVEQRALADFGRLHAALTEAEVKVTLFVNSVAQHTPDAVFPNNWFSTHVEANGRSSYVLYPMKSPSRRNERRADVISFLRSRYTHEVSLVEWETHADAAILEGTGSLVLDRIRRVCYVALSERANLRLARRWAELMEYSLVTFTSQDAQKKVVYHTNVVMSVGTSYAVVCTESMSASDREQVLSRLNHHDVIEISLAQMNEFCGNVLELSTPRGLVLAMSTRAYNAFTPTQRERLLKHVQRLVHADISTIETVGGGGVRCMLAELY